MEHDLTPNELRNALKELNRGKCPGSNGITVECYARFWRFIEKPLFDSLMSSIQDGKLSVEQRRGIITPIPKKDLNRKNLKNWRPITLLNLDYKLLTKAYAIRLQSCIGEIVHEDQSGFMSGRYIGTNVRTIEDVIQFSTITDTHGWILGCDFSKAFDTVRWELIIKALRWFGFGDNFIDVITMPFVL